MRKVVALSLILLLFFSPLFSEPLSPVSSSSPSLQTQVLHKLELCKTQLILCEEQLVASKKIIEDLKLQQSNLVQQISDLKKSQENEKLLLLQSQSEIESLLKSQEEDRRLLTLLNKQLEDLRTELIRYQTIYKELSTQYEELSKQFQALKLSYEALLLKDKFSGSIILGLSVALVIETVYIAVSLLIK